MPFAPSPTDGSIPTDLVLLAAERAVTVTREEHHQDVLSGRTGRAVVEAAALPDRLGKARWSGRARGRARRPARRRADPPDGAALPADGRPPDGRGVPRGVRGVPSGRRPRDPGRAPVARRADDRRASERPASGPRADSPAPAPGSVQAGSDDRHCACRAAAAPAGSDDRNPARDATHTRAWAISPRALGRGRGDRGAAARLRPRQRRPGRPTGRRLATTDRRCGTDHLLPCPPPGAGDRPDPGRRRRRRAGGCARPHIDRTGSASGGGVEARDPGTSGDVQARATDGPGRTEAGAGSEAATTAVRLRPELQRMRADRARRGLCGRAAAATARRT